MVGDLLYGTVFNYFALNDLQDQITAKSTKLLSYRLPSYGIFSNILSPQYWFGLPKNVILGGLSMDIVHMKQHRTSKTNNVQEEVLFSQGIGTRMSLMEHALPEHLFSTDTDKAQGVSAVKALAIASQQGQKIWTITQANLELALSRINLGEATETDIRNAVNAGKVVTAPEAQINFNDWIGEGYTVIEQESGAGAYLIAGGGNGGVLFGLGYTLGASLFLVGMNWAGSSLLLGPLAPVALIFFTYFIIAIALIAAIEIALPDDPKAALKVFGLGLGIGAAAYSLANEGLFKANIPGLIIRMVIALAGSYLSQ